jgi:hypothetical protein
VKEVVVSKQSGEEVGKRHLELLKAIDEVARRDPAGVSTSYRAADKVGLDLVCKQADRQEFMHLAHDLQAAGYVKVGGITYLGLRASYALTDEGHRRLEES